MNKPVIGWEVPDIEEQPQVPEIAAGDAAWAPPDVETTTKKTPKTSQQIWDEMGPWRRVKGGINHLLRGIPIAGNFVPESEEAKLISQASPEHAAAGTTIGGILGTLPFASASVLPMAGSFAKQALVAGGAGTGLTLADAYTSDKPPENATEALLTGGIGALGGALGPALGRVMAPAGIARNIKSPDLPPPPKFKKPKGAKKIDGRTRAGKELKRIKEEAREMANIPGPAGPNSQLQQLVNRRYAPQVAQETATDIGPFVGGLVSGAAGHYLSGGDPVTTMLLGATGMGGQRALSKFAKSKTGERYLGHKIRPETQALLNAITMGTGQQINDLPNVENQSILNTLSGR